MSDFSHMPQGDAPDAMVPAERLATELHDTIKKHVHEHSDPLDRDKPPCPGCVAVSLYNAMMAFCKESEWTEHEKVYAVGVLNNLCGEHLLQVAPLLGDDAEEALATVEHSVH